MRKREVKSENVGPPAYLFNTADNVVNGLLFVIAGGKNVVFALQVPQLGAKGLRCGNGVRERVANRFSKLVHTFAQPCNLLARAHESAHAATARCIGRGSNALACKNEDLILKRGRISVMGSMMRSEKRASARLCAPLLALCRLTAARVHLVLERGQGPFSPNIMQLLQPQLTKSVARKKKEKDK
jgi:hypothetical protein